MPAISRSVGTTSEKLAVFVPDATVSTGAGLANIVASSVSIGWWRNDMSAVSNYTATTGTLGTWGTSSFVQHSSTDALGWYQVSVPDGAFVSGSEAILHIYGAPNMAPVPVLIELTKENNQQYTSSKTFSSTQVITRVETPVGVSTVTIPLGVSSVSIPVGVSSISTPVTASSVTAGVNVSSIRGTAAVTTAAGVLSAGVSTVTGSVGTVVAPVGVSTVTIPVSVSSISIPVSVSSVTDKAGYSVSSAAAAVNEAMADAILNRNVSSGANTGRLVKEALYVLRNKVDAGLGIVYETDDETSSWAFSVSTVAGDPILVIDPT